MVSVKVVVLLLAVVAAAKADSSLLDTFEQSLDSALATEDKTHVGHRSLEACATACREQNSFKCRSFEWEPKSQYCAISALCRRHGVKLSKVLGRQYYEDIMDRDEVVEATEGTDDDDADSDHDGHPDPQDRDHGHGGIHSDRYRDHHPIFPPGRHGPGHGPDHGLGHGSSNGSGDGKKPHHHHWPTAKSCSCYRQGKKGQTSGVFRIKPDPESRSTNVYCDMTSDGGPWTVLTRRTDGSVNFTRTWAEYVAGFGSLKGEFWIGLEAMHQLTKSGLYELRIDVEKTTGEKIVVSYRLFHVKSRDFEYALDVEGFNGTMSNMLASNNRQQFAAFDRTSSTSMDKCALALHGGWWYSTCKSNSPNGIYVKKANPDSHEYGIQWRRPDGTSSWGKSVEMKIRPLQPVF